MSYSRYLFKYVLKNTLFACLMFLTLGSSSMASEVVLDEIKIKDIGDFTIVDILFGVPLKYQKHFPQRTGEIVQIQLSLDLDKAADPGTSEHRQIHKEVREGGELISPDGGKSVLVYVTYEEGVPGGPYLTLRFSHSVRFEVLSGPSRRSLSVKIFNDTPKEKDKKDAKGKPQESNVDLMMAKARQAITFGNNKGAIDLLRKIIRSSDNTHTQEANELLGLALERDKQIPRAKYEYKKYLKRYPEGEGSERVKQRLAALQELRVKAKRKLRSPRAVRDRSQFTTFGRLTQAYSEYYLDRELDAEAEELEDELQQQLLSTHFSIKSRYRSVNRTIQTVFNASHTYDFLAGDEDREDDEESEADIRRMYVDVNDTVYGIVGRAGRQSSRNGGVFGTFDGLIAGYRVAPRWLVSAMVGKPLIHTFDDSDIYEKFFYGIKADTESTDKKFGSNMFYVRQEVDGILDREAVGGNLRYARKGLSMFGMMDYDVSYNELSLLNTRIGWNYTESNKLNFSYNRRNLVLTSQALRGAPGILTIDDLLDYLSASEIRKIAAERTAVSETLTIGNSYQFTKDQQFNFDVTALQTEETPDGIDPVKEREQIENPTLIIDTTAYGAEATGLQFIYAFQWVSSNTFVERDLYVVGFRLSDFTSYTDHSAFVNARIPMFEKWRSGVRLNISDRDSESFGKRTTISPVFRLSYRLSRDWSFDAELGLDFVDNVGQPDEERRRMRLAYNYTF